MMMGAAAHGDAARHSSATADMARIFCVKNKKSKYRMVRGRPPPPVAGALDARRSLTRTRPGLAGRIPFVFNRPAGPKTEAAPRAGGPGGRRHALPQQRGVAPSIRARWIRVTYTSGRTPGRTSEHLHWQFKYSFVHPAVHLKLRRTNRRSNAAARAQGHYRGADRRATGRVRRQPLPPENERTPCHPSPGMVPAAQSTPANDTVA